MRWKWLLLFGLTEVATGVQTCYAPLRAQEPSHLHGFYLSTGCDHGAPSTVIRDSSLIRDTMAMQEMQAHEAVHRDQLGRAGHTCEEWLGLLTSTPAKLIEAEREAYQAQAMWDVAHYGSKANTDNFWFNVSRALYMFFDKKVPYAEIVRRLGGTRFADIITQQATP